MNIEVIVLAAGKGTRMYSDTPKVLHPLAGKPLLTHVLDTALKLGADQMHVVTGYQSEQIRTHYQDQTRFSTINWVLQAEQLGTGHAVQQVSPFLGDHQIVIVLYGDVPLVSHENLQRLASLASHNGIAVLTLETDDPHGLGRIIRDQHGNLIAIVEEKDASPEQRRIKEINTGIMAFQSVVLKKWLAQLTTNNAQGEYYLTDTVAMANADGVKVATLATNDKNEVQGVNNRLQLSDLERCYQINRARQLALGGVTVMDPNRLDIRGDLTVGRDVSIEINVIFEGHNRIGDRVSIGPNVTIINSSIGDDCSVLANSHLENVTLAASCTVGPFARLRPGTVLHKSAKIGNFVETKKAIIGTGSKVNHLSYIGDAMIGSDVNVGAGTITCNYDGVNKHQTTINDGAFIGSNTALVAPVVVGKNATIAAGSVINMDIAEGELGVARGKQRNVSSWKRPVKKQD
jgi:bifunctional UDP-N-acetylglucosamine pyrophosphorylase / glucosamine-1-phosphate N-acetyltransferase